MTCTSSCTPQFQSTHRAPRSMHVSAGCAPSLPTKARRHEIPRRERLSLPGRCTRASQLRAFFGVDGPFQFDPQQGVDFAAVVWNHKTFDAVGLASAGSTVEALSLFGQIRSATSLPGSASTVGNIPATAIVAAPVLREISQKGQPSDS